MFLELNLPKKIDRICLDLDDVLVDFEGGVEKLIFGKKIKDLKEQSEFWNNISLKKEFEDRMWEAINKSGSDWWANLDKLPWADDLWEAVNKVCDDVIILSSPGNSRSAGIAAKGKIEWSIKEYGYNKLCLTKNKYVCSRKGVLLIDDLEKFISPWKKFGGSAIKLRKRWETVGVLPQDIIDFFRKS